MSIAVDDTMQRIRNFTSGFSIEAARLDAAEIATLRDILPPGTAVYLTALPGARATDSLDSCARLHAAGLDPVPHIAARMLPDINALDDALARMSEAGVRRVLAIAGDIDSPQGPFGSALDLIESGLLQRHGIEGVGISGYADGHPRIAKELLDRARADKIAAAKKAGLTVHIVTQFSFDAAAIMRWIARVREQGVDCPIRIGMAGPTNLARLLRYAQRCGVRASAQGLTRQTGLVRQLLGSSAPDGLIRPIAEANADGRLGDVAAHFYSFGGVPATARWAAAVAAGQFSLGSTEGFRVETA